MEKLIELINEHQKEKHSDGVYLPVVAYRDGIFFSDGDCLSWVVDEIHLVSKNYGFIKWLVENDKINFDKIIEKSEYLIEYRGNKIDQNMTENTLLMLLSISDTPIEDLLLYLK